MELRSVIKEAVREPASAKGFQGGQRKVERRPFPPYGFRPNPSTQPFNHPLARGETNPAAGNVFPVKPPKRFEYVSSVSRFESFPVVTDGHPPKGAFTHSFNPNSWDLTFPAVLDGVSNQILKHHDHLRAIGGYLRKGSECDLGSTLLDMVFKFQKRNSEWLLQRHQSSLLRGICYLRVRKNVLHQAPEPLKAFNTHREQARFLPLRTFKASCRKRTKLQGRV